MFHGWKKVIRDAPIDQPMIGIGRFLAWPARIGDRPVSLTSCRFWADPFIANGAGRDVTATRTLTVDITVNMSFHVRMILILMAFSVNSDW